MTDLLLSGPALLPGGDFAESTLRVGAGRIVSMRPGPDPAADLHDQGWICPGLIDLQLNGGYGLDFTVDPGSVVEVAARLPATGTTAFLPTLITSPWDSYPQRLRRVGEAMRLARGARPIGLHLEGPYLNPARKGAHDPACLRAVDVEEMLGWADPALVRIVTLAPELPGALRAIAALTARRIVVSAGHSEATYAEAQAGFAAGVRWGTHLYNAMRPLGHREPGLTGALLTGPVPCGLIPDGVHVHPAAVRLAFQARGVDGLTLVTDSMAAMGMPPGRFHLAGREVTVTESDVRLADGTLAGSRVTMDAAVRLMQTYSGCSLAQSVRMAAETPARLLGLPDCGRLLPEARADIVILDDSHYVQLTLVQGQLAFRR